MPISLPSITTFPLSPTSPHYLNHHSRRPSTLPQPSLTPTLHTTSTITHTHLLHTTSTITHTGYPPAPH
ncbi:MAG: hypothetical protein L0922_02690, partial [Candidatus Mariimomonas ferrooxydans]